MKSYSVFLLKKKNPHIFALCFIKFDLYLLNEQDALINTVIIPLFYNFQNYTSILEKMTKLEHVNWFSQAATHIYISKHDKSAVLVADF